MGPLVVSRDDEHRNTSIGYSAEGLERLVRERRDDPGPIEHVTRVHHDIDLARERRLQRGGVVRQEVVTTPASLDARPDGEIEAEVGVATTAPTTAVRTTVRPPAAW
jgi:hypothetical protein